MESEPTVKEIRTARAVLEWYSDTCVTDAMHRHYVQVLGHLPVDVMTEGEFAEALYADSREGIKSKGQN